jgi:undecaprenyl-diphosphatase
LVKLVLKRTRPPTPVARGKTEPAFPSGHTTGTTALVLSIALVAARAGLGTPGTALGSAAGVALLVGLSRIYLDEHWATDVLGGLAIGSAAALASVAAV